MSITRRTFLAAAPGAAASGLQGQTKLPPLLIFSKHLSKLNYDEVGKAVREMGFDGVDLTVRPGGHVLPERAAADLPRAVDAIRAHGVSVPMISTALISASDPAARPTLSSAGKLNVACFKPGYWKYKDADVDQALANVKAEARNLFEMAREYGVAAGWHNHSGDNVGAAVWDTRQVIADLDPRWIGYYFDPMHATIEGGAFGWQLSSRIALKRLKMVAAKDFYWTKSGDKWKTVTCPLGEGMVDYTKFFSMLAAVRFQGPISIHIEYNPADQRAAMVRDLEFVRKHLKAAYRIS